MGRIGGTHALDHVATRAWRWLLAAGALVTAVSFLVPDPELRSLTHQVAGGLAMVGIAVGVRIHGSRHATGWHLLAAGIAAWVVGDVVRTAHEVVFDTRPYPSPADVPHLASYPLLLLGAALVARSRVAWRDPLAALDAAAVSVALLLPIWVLVGSPAAGEPILGSLGRIVAAGYPLADVLVLGLVVRALLGPGTRSPSWLLLLAGLGATAAGDLVVASPAVEPGGRLGGLVLVGHLLLGAAALHPGVADLDDAPAATGAGWRRRSLVLAALAAPATLALGAVTGDVRHVPLSVTVAAVVLGLVLARTALVRPGPVEVPVAEEPAVTVEDGEAARAERLHHDLRDALEHGGLLLHYQPRVDLGHALVQGVEALLRWQHPERGVVRPAEVLAVAREHDLLVPLGRWVLAEACRQLRQWQRDDPATSPVEISVNVAVEELLEPGYVRRVEQVLADERLPPTALVLELDDDALADTSVDSLDVLEELRALGVHVCIDRFGSGRRSLANVRRVPADRVNVDLALITDVAGDAPDGVVLSTVLALGRAMGLEVTVTGVETRTQRAHLERHGCTHGQGHLWAPPLPPGSVLDAVLGRTVA